MMYLAVFEIIGFQILRVGRLFSGGNYPALQPAINRINLMACVHDVGLAGERLSRIRALARHILKMRERGIKGGKEEGEVLNIIWYFRKR